LAQPVVPGIRKIGLALSGGTLKSVAHIGVIDALNELGIHPTHVAGTSAGSLIATLYAHGYSDSDFKELYTHFSLWRIIDYGFPVASSLWTWSVSHFHKSLNSNPPHGVIRGKRLQKFFREMVGDRPDQIPYYIIATDLISGNPVVFSNDKEAIEKRDAQAIGDLATCITGSCALPGVFSPVAIDKWLLTDGAFRHYVPVEVLRKAGCTTIIAVNLYKLKPNWRPLTAIHVLARSYEILLQQSIEDETQGDDVLLLTPQVDSTVNVSYRNLHTYVHAGKRSVYEKSRELSTIMDKTVTTKWSYK